MAKTPPIADVLGYPDSPHYLQGEALDRCPDYAHVFRRARPSSKDKACGLKGVYVLRDQRNQDAVVPVVYVCEAGSDQEADAVHQRVWNQNAVPFLLVQTRHHVRLYSGFRFQQATPTRTDLERGILRTSIALADAPGENALQAFSSQHIDDGRLWRKWGHEINPSDRVDWRLLENLRHLADRLCDDTNRLSRHAAHGLIGKYVYLNYLRARGILSDPRLKEWSIAADDVFSKDAKITVFRKLLEKLDGWLNGSVFPFDLSGVQSAHLHLVAGAFNGDEVVSGQSHLDFPAFDFSYIPTETLSVMYEQFLHAPDAKGKSKGKTQGAYYTPIPVVNFMLAELEQRKPLQPGMRVVDMSCGSGAFLVQVYRRLIEKERARLGTGRLKPARLSKLLTDSIFGVDLDEDACRVAGLSLIMTLLDNIDPPDLTDPKTKCAPPDLHKGNILQSNAFDAHSKWGALLESIDGFDWIVGNPPWGDIKTTQTLGTDDRVLLDWMRSQKVKFPTGGNQKAEAFAWKALQHCKKNGVIGLLIPAMTLFKMESRAFREQFVQQSNLWCVANLANLATVLFAGSGAVNPAAALFYAPMAGAPEDSIPVYSPLLANQESFRSEGKKKSDTWAIVVNAAEIRYVPRAEILSGEMLPWKIAAWGSPRDARLLHVIEKRGFPTLDDLKRECRISLAEGVQLRTPVHTDEGCVPVPELQGKPNLDVKQLAGRGPMVVFPPAAVIPLPKERAFLRTRGGTQGLGVNKPPHILLGVTRGWSVYSDKYMIVPARQIGIAGKPGDESLLKALSLYLLSDYAFYHQFFMSTQFGVKRSISTLDALKALPIPLMDLPSVRLADWTDLHARLVRSQTAMFQLGQFPLANQSPGAAQDVKHFHAMLLELNRLTNDALGLDQLSRKLVRDFVHVRYQLDEGRTKTGATEPPDLIALRDYADALATTLNAYFSDAGESRCAADIVYDKSERHAMVFLNVDEHKKRAARVLEASETGAQNLRKIGDLLRTKHAQWVYFNRDLRVYEGSWIYLFKPLQHFHFTVSQAMTDADEIIGDLLSAEAGE